MSVAVLSLFEGGYQPLTALTAFTALRNAGEQAEFCDLYVSGIESIDEFADRNIIAISVPLFDSLQAAASAVQRLRAQNAESKIIFFGQYATINASRLVGRYCDYAIAGEWEQAIVGLVRKLSGKSDGKPAGVMDIEAVRNGGAVLPQRPRDQFVVPDRSVAPSLEKYPQPQLDKLLGEKKKVGGVETTRGCHHRCTYCSVYAAYDGKVLLSRDDLIVSDVANLVDLGMEHLSFVDADFFNARKYALRVLRRLHSEFPNLTYDFTTRVDHLLENRDSMEEMAQMNVKVVTSALEFPSQIVLDQLDKEIRVETIAEAVALLAESGIRLNPTFIMFNPWTNLDDIVRFYDFIEANRLIDIIDPIQFETRLHLYKGSPLLSNRSIQRLRLTEQEFHFEWEHPDPRVDQLFRMSVSPPEPNGSFKRCCLKC
jgi:radical SAM superfamily enzyme YgiQ (UPF0313 family)